jgi:pantetheine-phosphate adenylyltransferase
MKRIAVFPGSFDPFTKGHESVTRRALDLFDEVIVAIGVNSTKTSLFDLAKRKAHIAHVLSDSRIKVIDFSGLTVNLCQHEGAQFIIRGLRDGKDFDYEKSIALMNEKMAGIPTVFVLTEPEFGAINASIVREIVKSGGDISAFVTNAEMLV